MDVVRSYLHSVLDFPLSDEILSHFGSTVELPEYTWQQIESKGITDTQSIGVDVVSLNIITHHTSYEMFQ